MIVDLVAATVAIGLACWVFVLMRREASTRAVLRSMGNASRDADGEAESASLTLIAAGALSGRLESRLGRRLARAGRPSARAFGFFMLARCLALVVAAGACYLAWRLTASATGPALPPGLPQVNPVVPAMAVASSLVLVPDLFLLWRGFVRREQVRRDLPFILDSVVMLHEAGVGFDEALSRVYGQGGGALEEELGTFLREVRFGLPRIRAWKNLALRVNVEAVEALAGAMIQGEQIGAGLSQTLRAQARSVREKSFESALERAQKLPVKLVFPLVLCFFPSIFVITLGSSLLRFFDLFDTNLAR